jgi:hypothetical protein
MWSAPDFGSGFDLADNEPRRVGGYQVELAEATRHLRTRPRDPAARGSAAAAWVHLTVKLKDCVPRELRARSSTSDRCVRWWEGEDRIPTLLSSLDFSTPTEDHKHISGARRDSDTASAVAAVAGSA